jgi:hypothetical protein
VRSVGHRVERKYALKLLICTACSDIRALDPKCAWTTCRCGACSAKWVDPSAGTVVVRADDRRLPRILGLNNAFLIPACRGMEWAEIQDCGGRDAAWRKRHKESTNAPGYLFDESRRECWACVIQVGESNDVSWYEEPAKTPEGTS